MIGLKQIKSIFYFKGDKKMRFKKTMLGIALLATGMMFTGCFASQETTNTGNKATQKPVVSQNATTENNQQQLNGKEKKILITYFSHSGNTKAFAQSIQKEVGGDLFAIEPQNVYPTNYDEVVAQAKQEVESGYQPQLKNKIDLSTYDVIFVGTPIWWYTVAPPVRTFLSENDLAGKTIIPFSTHKGSGLSGIDRTMQELQPQATVLKGFAIWDNQANDKQADIASWLNELNLQ